MNSVICVGSGCYCVVWVKNYHSLQIAVKLMSGQPVNHRTGHYRYSLFCSGSDGFLVRRKDVGSLEQDPPWVDVCELRRISSSVQAV